MPKKRLPASSSAASLLLLSSSPSSVRSRFWLGLKVVGVTSVLICLFAFLKIQAEYRTSAFYLAKVRTAAEEASSSLAPFEGPPKVAFLFLARAGLPLDFLWHAFFQNGDAGKFSIYIHSKPGFVFDASTTRSPYFYGRQLKRSVKVAWGESSMIEAERLLLKAALTDPANQRFALLSDRCVPLRNFSYVYNYLMSSSKSFIDSFLDVKEDRYNPKMFPTIPKDKWRKGSQWATMVRKHAEVVVSDDIVFPVFRRYCKRRPELNPRGSKKIQVASQKAHNCIPDEHYIPTLFSMSELEDEIERRTLTYTLWNQSTSRKEKPAWHPITFQYPDASALQIKQIQKINQKNTWDLSLIDHLSEIIRVESEDDAETNFQKASCTLEAGVKIYSLRVDSVHSKAYKVLGGINRAGRDDDKENVPEVDNIDTQQEECITKKEIDKKISPLSTLESSFDALNVKKFDVAFTVDPLYHQTSAQFDEGGAKGLLLNNLGVYGGCQVLFDSLESPTKVMSCDVEKDKEFVDLSFARDYIEKMMLSMQSKMDISPTLREIVSQFDEDHQRPSDTGLMPQKIVGQEEVSWSNKNEFESNVFTDCGPVGFDEDDRSSVVDDGSYYMNANCIDDQEENDSYPVLGQDTDYKFETIANFLSFGLGFASKTNAWAGPDHWKYRKIKGPEAIPVSTGEALPTKKNKKSKKQEAPDIDFTRALDEEIPNIFAPPRNQKTTLLPSNRVSCSFTLPEDCHYRPESLVKLILRPDVLCLGKKQRKSSDELNRQTQAHESIASWDNEGVAYDHFDDGNYASDLEEPGSLVSQPRQVNKIEVQYDKSSKQVDVHALKETLWCIIKGSIKLKEMAHDAVVSFRQVLGSFYESCEASSAHGISPHLCFICLLHLANEHCLSIHDSPSLDELEIGVPCSATPAVC